MAGKLGQVGGKLGQVADYGCSLVFLWALWDALLRPWTPKREARSVQKTISGQHRSSNICVRFIVFSEITDPKYAIGDALWPIVSTFDDRCVPLVPFFLIFEPDLT